MTLGNPITSTYPWNHIVRVEWVEAGGLKVDDPFGQVTKVGEQYTYPTASQNAGTGEDGQGRDNLWTWEMVEAIVSAGSYVQTYAKGERPSV